MGFPILSNYTLRAALDCDGIQAVDVIEIEGYIINWAKSFFRLEEVFGRTGLITVQDMDRRGRLTDYFIYRTRSLEN